MAAVARFMESLEPGLSLLILLSMLVAAAATCFVLVKFLWEAVYALAR